MDETTRKFLLKLAGEIDDCRMQLIANRVILRSLIASHQAPDEMLACLEAGIHELQPVLGAAETQKAFTEEIAPLLNIAKTEAEAFIRSQR